MGQKENTRDPNVTSKQKVKCRVETKGFYYLKGNWFLLFFFTSPTIRNLKIVLSKKKEETKPKFNSFVSLTFFKHFLIFSFSTLTGEQRNSRWLLHVLQNISKGQEEKEEAFEKKRIVNSLATFQRIKMWLSKQYFLKRLVLWRG